jgi:lipopolysaccharide biosynthesis regulator YciM
MMNICDSCGTKIEDTDLKKCVNTEDGVLLCLKCYVEAQIKPVATLIIPNCSKCPYHTHKWNGFHCRKGKSIKPNPNITKLIGKQSTIPTWCPLIV